MKKKKILNALIIILFFVAGIALIKNDYVSVGVIALIWANNLGKTYNGEGK